jgi:uncharacterized membrane protein
VTTTASTSPDVHGPIDFVLIEFPADQLSGEAGPALLDLVERGVIRLYDLVVIRKAEDGSVEGMELDALPGGAVELAVFAGARSGLVGDDDIREAAEAMRPGTVAALVVYENAWAVPFVGAVRNSGGELVASGRIPAPVVMAALDQLETKS